MSRPRRVYVASKFNNYAEVCKVQDELWLLGCETPFDWTQHVGDADSAAIAQKNFEGVETADALLILAVPEMRGAYVEMGIALARDIPIHVFDRTGIPFQIFNLMPLVSHHSILADAIIAAAGRP